MDLEGSVQKSGVLIAIEGTDRSAVSSQAKLLTERLLSCGYNAVHIQATNPHSPEGYYINRYESAIFDRLPINKPYTPVLFYALNHLAVATEIQKSVDETKVVICDQYVLTNYITNVTRDIDSGEFYDWLMRLEYTMLGLKHPEYSIILGSHDDVRLTNISEKLAGLQYSVVEQSDGTITGNHADIWDITMNVLTSHSIVKSKGVTTKSESHMEKPDESNETLFDYSLSSLAFSNLQQARLNLGITSDLKFRSTEAIFYPDTLKGSAKKLYEQSQETLSRNYFKFYDLLKKQYPTELTVKLSEQIKSVATVTDITTTLDPGRIHALADILQKYKNTELSKLAQTFPNNSLVGGENRSSVTPEEITAPLLGDYNTDISLTEVMPKNELRLVDNTIFPNSTLSSRQIAGLTSDLKYVTKSELLKTLVSRPDLLRTQPQYTFDLLLPFDAFTSLLNLNIGSIVTQERTPHYGFAYPKQINTPELEAIYDESFDTAFTSYQKLYEEGYTQEAQYCTLYGHKNRIKITLNWPEVKLLLSSKISTPGFKKLQTGIKHEVQSVHPILNESL